LAAQKDRQVTTLARAKEWQDFLRIRTSIATESHFKNAAATHFKPAPPVPFKPSAPSCLKIPLVATKVFEHRRESL